MFLDCSAEELFRAQALGHPHAAAYEHIWQKVRVNDFW
jgi:hypothetical protein